MVRVRSSHRPQANKCYQLLFSLFFISIIFIIITTIYYAVNGSSGTTKDLSEYNMVQSELLKWKYLTNKKKEDEIRLKDMSDVEKEELELLLEQRYEKEFEKVLKLKQKDFLIKYNTPEYRLSINNDGSSKFVPLFDTDDSNSTNSINVDFTTRENATFVSLVRNSELDSILSSIRIFEDRFNKNFHYPWVFLNDEPFTSEFKLRTATLCSGQVFYGKIDKSSEWSIPDWLDKPKVKSCMKKMTGAGVIYGDSLSYRHMCRYQSGFFWRHPLMNQFKYYWRVEPNVKIYCDLKYDIFKFMREFKKKYSFTISILEYPQTIKTLWRTTREFLMSNYPDYLKNPQNFDNLLQFISDDNGRSFNLCHFWSNFEVADLDFWRSKQYQEYFNYLDKAGGFFYERWGDAPVHSIAASIFLKRDEVHYFTDFGYYHPPMFTCPRDPAIKLENNCLCDSANKDIAFTDFSCVPKYYEINNYNVPGVNK